jgi:hypothetical protein
VELISAEIAVELATAATTARLVLYTIAPLKGRARSES